MMKIRFEENEMLVIAMFDTGNRQTTLKDMRDALPFVEDDNEIYSLVIQTIEKMKCITDMDYHELALDYYKQDTEDGM